ncbi:MAG: type II toxin-antitoxin system VapC family toxin [Vulcanimicrobiaceae bacterium]
MNAVVLDASIVIKWFRSAGEVDVDAARSFRADVAAGKLAVHTPPLLFLEIVNVAGRRWHWQRPELLELTYTLGDLGFEVNEPPLAGIAEWTARGLTAYDASYVALAEFDSLKLITDDERLLAIAPDIAISLSAFEA